VEEDVRKDLDMDWLDYREKLGIGFNDDAKFEYFKTIIFNKLYEDEDGLFNQISDEEYFSFCYETGTQYQKIEQHLHSSPYKEIMILLHNQYSYMLTPFLAFYIAFVNCQKDNKYKKHKKKDYIKILEKCLTDAHIQYETIRDKDGYFIFPRGVKEFDDALISEPLHWLSAYPKAERAWAKALREYADQNDQNASDIADLFRKALETFFQEFFHSNKTLENLKTDYGNYLKNKGIPKEISGNLEPLLQAYTNFMNNYAKHHDATSDKVLEYLMYNTGNIIRLIITLEKDNSK